MIISSMHPIQNLIQIIYLNEGGNQEIAYRFIVDILSLVTISYRIVDTERMTLVREWEREREKVRERTS